MKRTRVPWSKVLNDARAASERAQGSPPVEEAGDDADLEPLIPRETLKEYARDALRSAYEGLDGLVLDLDD